MTPQLGRVRLAGLIGSGRSAPLRAGREQFRGSLALADLRAGQASGRRHPVRRGDQVQLQPHYPRESAAQ